MTRECKRFFVARHGVLGLVAATLLTSGLTGSAAAEISTIRLAEQPGLGYLPLMVMRWPYGGRSRSKGTNSVAWCGRRHRT